MYLLIAAFAERRAELSLLAATDSSARTKCGWTVKRDLARFLLPRILEFLETNNLKLADLDGLGVFAGPAAFTDLRITHAVANALAYGLGIPVVNAGGRNWRRSCRRLLAEGKDFKIIKPAYGRPAQITERKK